jgi:hypothetical protein
MIQRIQTVYLFVSALLLGLLFLLPFAEIAKEGAIYTFNFKGILLDGAVQQSGIAISVLIVVIMALHGFAISSFKKASEDDCNLYNFDAIWTVWIVYLLHLSFFQRRSD